MLTAFLSARILRRCGVGALVMAALPLWADSQDSSFTLLTAQFGTTPAPSVKETAQSPSGTTTGYNWEGVRRNGLAFDVGARHGVDHDWGGLEWGAELEVANANLRPSDYHVAGGDYINSTGPSLAYRTLGVNLLGGYEWGNPTDDAFHPYFEALPLLGAGLVSAQDDVTDANGNIYRKNARSWYVQYGLRLGAYLTEEQWIYGFTLGAEGGYAKLKFAFPTGDSSTVAYQRFGFTLAAALAYRF
jgi:hypothetical protein